MIKSIPLSEPPFVGRSRELEELLQNLASSIEGKTRILLVSGESGSGKTRLIKHFINSLSENIHIITLSGQCQSDSNMPYLPFIEAFESLIKTKRFSGQHQSLSEEKILDLLTWFRGPKKSEQNSVLSAPNWRNRTFGLLRETLTSLCARAPVLILLEDIQWADSTSLEILQSISNIPFQKLLVIGTIDSDSFVSNKAFEAIKGMSICKEIKLKGLTSNEVSTLLNRITGKTIQMPFAERICVQFHGNPLLVVEYSRMIHGKQDSSLQSIALSDENLPVKLEEIILPRVFKINLEQRKLIDIASVFESNFDLNILSAVLVKDIVEVMDNLQTIAKVTLLLVREGPYYKFSHRKIKEVFYQAIQSEDRQAYHKKIAEQIEKEPTPQVEKLYHHYSMSNNQEKTIYYALAAGEHALLAFSNVEASKYFKYIIDKAVDNPLYASQKEYAYEGLGDALLEMADVEAVNVFEQLSEQAKTPVMKMRGLRKAAYASLLQGDYDHAFALIRKPLSYEGLDGIESARFLLTKGKIEAWGALMPDAIQDLEKALKTFQNVQSVGDEIDSLIELSVAYMQRPEENSTIGNPEKSLSTLLRALTLCRQTEDLNKHFYGLTASFVILMECGLLEQAGTASEEISKIIEKIFDPEMRDEYEPWKYWVLSFITEKKTLDTIFGKIYDRLEFSFSPKIELNNEARCELQTALDQSKKGEILTEKTNLLEIQGLLLCNLAREQSFLGEQNEITIQKLKKNVSEFNASRFILEKSLYLYTRAIEYLMKQQWQETNQYFIESVDYYSNMRPGTSIEAQIRQWYCVALLQQGQPEKAFEQLAQANKIIKILEKKLTDTNIVPTFVLSTKLSTDKEFMLKVDLTNVGKNPVYLQQISNLMQSNFKILHAVPNLKLKGANVEANNQEIPAFKSQSYTFTIAVTTPGKYIINPEIIYTDNRGQQRIQTIEPLSLTIQGVQTPIPQAPAPVPQKKGAHWDNAPILSSNNVTRKPFDVFLCYKKSSGKDFADHLKAGLEELGLHTFLDSKDIPQIVQSQEAWTKVRDQAIEDCRFFILIMTPGFNLSSEVVKEIDMARKQTNKTFIFFRHRNMGRRIVVNFANDSLDIGKLEQVSFESKEELLRHAVNFLPCSKPS